MTYTVRVKRGLKANLPASGKLGEVFFATDTKELYVGEGPTNPLASVFSTADHSYTDAQLIAEVLRANAAYDPIGAAATAQSTAEGFATSADATVLSSAESYTDSSIATEVSNRNTAIGVETSRAEAAESATDAASTAYADAAVAVEKARAQTAELSQQIAVHQVGHGFSTGQTVYFTGSAWALAKSNAATTLGMGVIVIAGADDFAVYISGQISGLSGLTAGAYYFVSDATAGLVTVTEPTATSSFSNPVLFALSTTVGIVLPFRPAQIGINNSRIVNQGVGSYTAVAGDIVRCNTSGGNVTITVPLSSLNTGLPIKVKKVSSDLNTVTILPTGADTVEASTSLIITGFDDAAELIADGSSDWGIY